MARRAQAVVVPVLCILTACSIGAAEDAVALKLTPEFGDRRTMCVTWRMVTSSPTSANNERFERSRTVVAQFEPLSLAGDDICTLRVGLQRDCSETVIDAAGRREVLVCHDSARAVHRQSWVGARFVAYLGETFSANLSSQGRLQRLDTDAFYAAIAQNRVKLENDAALNLEVDPKLAGRFGFTAEHVKAKGKQKIEAADTKYGSRGRRLKAYREEAASFSLYGVPALRRLLSDVTAPLPDRPVRPGDQWKAPVTIELDVPIEMLGTHTLKHVADEVCTIQVEARGTVESKPLSGPGGLANTSAKLEGTYEATLTVERATGWLLRREAVMNLTGTIPKPGPPGAARGTIPAAAKVTLTAGPPE